MIKSNKRLIGEERIKYLNKEKFKYHYLNENTFRGIIEKQNYVCAICGKTNKHFNKDLYIDHDHSCCPKNKSCEKCFRALLCTKCNSALGLANDDVKLLQKMIDYINYHKERFISHNKNNAQ